MITRPASSPSLSAAASWVASSRSVRVGPHASGGGSGSAVGAGVVVSGSGSCGSSGPPGVPGVHAAQKSPAATARTAGRWWRIGASFTTRRGLLHHRECFRCDLPAFTIIAAHDVGDGSRADVTDDVAEILRPTCVLLRLAGSSLPGWPIPLEGTTWSHGSRPHPATVRRTERTQALART